MLQPRFNGIFMRQSAVRLPVLLIIYATLWLAAEVVAFGFVVRSIGFAGAILACFLTSLAGLAMLRRLGTSAAVRLRQALTKRAQDQGGLSREAVLDGTLSGLGAVLLILPGFVSDSAGAGLGRPLDPPLGNRADATRHARTAAEWAPRRAKDDRACAPGMVARRRQGPRRRVRAG